MLTFRPHTSEDGYRFSIHYNQDYSGDVVIEDYEERQKIIIPFHVLRSFFVRYVREAKIKALETLPAKSVLGID